MVVRKVGRCHRLLRQLRLQRPAPGGRPSRSARRPSARCQATVASRPTAAASRQRHPQHAGGGGSPTLSPEIASTSLAKAGYMARLRRQRSRNGPGPSLSICGPRMPPAALEASAPGMDRSRMVDALAGLRQLQRHAAPHHPGADDHRVRHQRSRSMDGEGAGAGAGAGEGEGEGEGEGVTGTTCTSCAPAGIRPLRGPGLPRRRRLVGVPVEPAERRERQEHQDDRPGAGSAPRPLCYPVDRCRATATSRRLLAPYSEVRRPGRPGRSSRRRDVVADAFRRGDHRLRAGGVRGRHPRRAAWAPDGPRREGQEAGAGPASTAAASPPSPSCGPPSCTATSWMPRTSASTSRTRSSTGSRRSSTRRRWSPRAPRGSTS